MTASKWNLGLGLFCAAFTAFSLFYWIPTDIETGVVEQDRREVIIGDGMGPFFLSICIGLLAATLIIGSTLRLLRGAPSVTPESLTEDDRTGDVSEGLSLGNILYLVQLLAIVSVSLTLMVWMGPLTVEVLKAAGHDLGSYRYLTGTVPYKYIGFITGGYVLVFGLITMIEGRSSLRGALTAVCTIAALITLYDVPFDTLLLPPNGDQ